MNPVDHEIPTDFSARSGGDPLTRRELLERSVIGLLATGAAAVLLSGCASGGGGRRSASALPDPTWPVDRPRPVPAPATAAGSKWQPPSNPVPTEILPRTAWAKGAPVYSRMNRSDRPYSWITVHHDGIDSFTDTSYEGAKRRIEQIRQAHLNRKGEPFGDIGYHFLIDPAGRVWAGRDLSWQGAHVAKENPGNLGICMLGHYDRQRPNQAQVNALDRFVRLQMKNYNVPLARVRTHQEWPSAHTACPGRTLQIYMKTARLPGGGITLA